MKQEREVLIYIFKANISRDLPVCRISMSQQVLATVKGYTDGSLWLDLEQLRFCQEGQMRSQGDQVGNNSINTEGLLAKQCFEGKMHGIL